MCLHVRPCGAVAADVGKASTGQQQQQLCVWWPGWAISALYEARAAADMQQQMHVS